MLFDRKYRAISFLEKQGEFNLSEMTVLRFKANCWGEEPVYFTAQAFLGGN